MGGRPSPAMTQKAPCRVASTLQQFRRLVLAPNLTPSYRDGRLPQPQQCGARGATTLPATTITCAGTCAGRSPRMPSYRATQVRQVAGIKYVPAQLGFPQFGRAVGHSRGTKASRWHWLPGNPPDFIAEKKRRAVESRGGRVPSPQPCRHLASAALSGPPPLLRDDLAHVRTPHGQHGVRHDLAPTAVHELTNVGATGGQCVAAIASGQAAHWQGLIFRSPGNGPTPA